MQIMLLAASLRHDSYNKKLANVVCALLKNRVGTTEIKLEVIDFAECDVPLYNGDIEETLGLPQNALNFIARLQKIDALILVSPEYNYSIPGTVKNFIDWVSRARPMPWDKIPILLLSASPALAGGSRGLQHLQNSLSVCGAYVFPKMFSLADAYQQFDRSGQLKDKNLQEALNKIIHEFLEYANKLHFP